MGNVSLFPDGSQFGCSLREGLRCPFATACPFSGCGNTCHGARRLHEGERLLLGSAVFVVREGCVKFAVRGDHDPWVAFYFPGEVIGLGGLVGEGALAVTNLAVATTESRLCRIPYSLLRHHIIERGGFALTMLGVCAQELTRLRTATLRLTRRSEARMAAFLLELPDRHARAGGDCGGALELGMPRVDIARHLNLTPETVSRVFARLVQQGVIDVDGRMVRLLDRPALAGIAAKNS